MEQIDKKKVYELLEAGKKPAEIYEEIGCTMETIAGYVKRYKRQKTIAQNKALQARRDAETSSAPIGAPSPEGKACGDAANLAFPSGVCPVHGPDCHPAREGGAAAPLAFPSGEGGAAAPDEVVPSHQVGVLSVDAASVPPVRTKLDPETEKMILRTVCDALALIRRVLEG